MKRFILFTDEQKQKTDIQIVNLMEYFPNFQTATYFKAQQNEESYKYLPFAANPT